MNIYVYSDESGVFDRYHNDKFVFAGLIFLDKTSKDKMSRKQKSPEALCFQGFSDFFINIGSNRMFRDFSSPF